MAINIDRLDVMRVMREAIGEIDRLRNKVFRYGNAPECNLEIMRELSGVILVLNELRAMERTKRQRFDPMALFRDRLEHASHIRSEIIRELSHECNRRIIFAGSDLTKAKYTDIGPYIPIAQKIRRVPFSFPPR